MAGNQPKEAREQSIRPFVVIILPAQPQPIKDPADCLAVGRPSTEGVLTSRILSFLWLPWGSPRACHKAKGFACIIVIRILKTVLWSRWGHFIPCEQRLGEVGRGCPWPPSSPGRAGPKSGLPGPGSA